jgi:hypothetical protein
MEWRMSRYLLDTGVAQDFINHRNGVRERADAARKEGNRIGICTPVLGELRSGVEGRAGRTDGFARIWDRSSGAMLGNFAAKGAILSMDGSIMATLTEAKVNLWNMKNRTLIGSFAGGPGIAGGAFSHDGTKIVTADEAARVVRL